MRDAWLGPAFTNALKWSIGLGCVFSWMSTKLVAVDVDPKRGVMLQSDFIHFADTLDCLLSSPSLPITEALYDAVLP